MKYSELKCKFLPEILYTKQKTELDNRDKKQQRTLRFDKSMLREALQTTVKMEREIIDFKKELTVRSASVLINIRLNTS